jgi:C_GCAxxG_C_C family probable redox protein
MNRSENAVLAFRTGLNCSQAILSTYSGLLGLETGAALRIAGGFGAGMARMQETCGAVTGAVMVIGLKMIDKNTGPDGLRGKVYDTIQDFFKRFREKNRTTECLELLDCDLRTAEGRKTFSDRNLSGTVCEKCVRDAAELLESMLNWN